MEHVSSVNIHGFPDHVLVELLGETADGEIAVRSFDLPRVDGETDRLRARPISETEYRDMIDQRLSAAGYTVLWQDPSQLEDGR